MVGIDPMQEALRLVETFERLPVERRVEIFRNLSAKAREELVSGMVRPGEIMRAISSEEVFFSIKELGEDNALGLIAATTSQQLIYLLDLELWKKTMFDTTSVARWLEIISTIGEEKVLQLLQTADPELLVTAMSRLIRVYVRNPELDLTEQQDSLPPYTLDDMFFVEFRYPRAEEAVKIFMETLFHWHIDYYRGLMQAVAAGATVEDEEMAAKWRRSRLSDRGFPEFDEALEIYQYLARDAIKDVLDDPLCGRGEDMGGFGQRVWYPMKVLVGDSLFRSCLNEISDPSECDRLSMELAHLANKVMVADGRDPGQLDQLTGSLKKVGGYINIALEEICGNDLQKATRLLKANHVEMLFRRGFSLILDLRKEAQKLVRESVGGVENLGYPLAGLMRGLMQKRPYYAENLLGREKSREFERLDDILYFRNIIERATSEETWEPI